MMSRLAVALLLIISSAIAQDRSKSSTGIIIPTPPSPTIPGEAMFALGQQSGRLDGIDKRLGIIETDVKDIGKDVSRINVIMWIVGGFLTLIIAPIIVSRVNQFLAGRRPPTAPA